MAELFEKLKCSKCKKYLSVLPIKVYCDRLVTCGRCSSENDGGIISTLYESVAQNLEFPCVNHFEGCRKQHLPKDMILHENTCNSSLISCSLCDFEGYSLELVDHVKQVHPNCFLDIPLFYISFNDSNKEEEYVYASESNYTLVIISIRYDSVVNRLHLSFNLICLKDECEKTLKFNLYSIDNNLIFESVINKFVPNSVGSSSSYDIFTDSYGVNKAICRFFIGGIKKDFKSNSCDKLPKPPFELIKCSESIKTKLPLTIIIKFVCNHVRSLKEERVSPSFIVLCTCWNISLETYDIQGTLYLGLFLNRLKGSYGCKNFCKVNFEITLLSLQEKNNIVYSSNKTFEKGRPESWGWREFIPFSELVDPENEYMSLLEDKIQLLVRLTLEKVI